MIDETYLKYTDPVPVGGWEVLEMGIDVWATMKDMYLISVPDAWCGLDFRVAVIKNSNGMLSVWTDGVDKDIIDIDFLKGQVALFILDKISVVSLDLNSLTSTSITYYTPTTSTISSYGIC